MFEVSKHTTVRTTLGHEAGTFFEDLGGGIFSKGTFEERTHTVEHTEVRTVTPLELLGQRALPVVHQPPRRDWNPRLV